MKAIYKRELKSYFGSVIAYIVIALILAFVGFVASYINLFAGYPNFEYALCEPYAVFALVIALSLLTMRCFADEKREKTDQLLYSLPIKMKDIVMGKYLAMLTVYLIPVAVMCAWPLILSFFGKVNMLQSYSTILAQLLLGACIIAAGMFLSSLTESQVIAAVMTIGLFLAVYFMPTIVDTFLPDSSMASFICFILMIGVVAIIVYALTGNIFAALGVGFVLEAVNLVLYLFKTSIFESAFPDMLNNLSIFNRLTPFANGTFDLTGVVYYLSITGVFVFLTVQSLEKKRYS
ncbi:MAG: ABC transporter permease subunit [Clostridia bacterium]|nr:ABC transporter permease subunit [Clostridia bacterium]